MNKCTIMGTFSMIFFIKTGFIWVYTGLLKMYGKINRATGFLTGPKTVLTTSKLRFKKVLVSTFFKAKKSFGHPPPPSRLSKKSFSPHFVLKIFIVYSKMSLSIPPPPFSGVKKSVFPANPGPKSHCPP